MNIKQQNFHFDNIDFSIKEKIINKLYEKIEVKDFRFLIIKNIDNVIDIKNNKYYISSNYGGIPSFLIFFKFDDTYHSYLIDRRSISFDKTYLNKHNLNNVRMTKVNVSVDIHMYDGTILDCILIDKQKNVGNKINCFKNDKVINQSQLIITDVLYLCNKNLTTQDYKNKIFLFNIFLKINYKNEKDDNIKLNVNPVYELNQVKELFTHYNKINHQILNIKGIVFHPQKSSVKLVYINNNQDNEYKEKLYDITEKISKTETKFEIFDNFDLQNVKKKIVFELKDISNNEDIKLNFEVKKHDCIPDIYTLYGLYLINNKIYKKKSGIAYIPDYNTTIKCKNIFQNKNKLILECLFYPSKGKWIPMKVSSIEKMHIINNEKRLKIIEKDIFDNEAF